MISNLPASASVSTHSLWATPTALAYTSTGQHLVSVAGPPGIARIFSPFTPDSEPIVISHPQLDNACACAAGAGPSAVVVACKTTVYLFDAATGAFKSLITRHTLPVTSLAASKDGAWIASGAEDHIVRLVNATDISMCTQLTGHAAPITGLAFDPLGNYLAAVAADGRLKIWDLADPARGCVGDVDLGRPTPGSRLVPHVTWAPNGSVLAAVAGDGKSAHLIGRSRLGVVRGKIGTHREVITSTSFSPNSAYLLTASHDVTLAMHAVSGTATQAPVVAHALKSVPLCAAFHPTSNAIAVATADQSLLMIDGFATDTASVVRPLAAVAEERDAHALADSLFGEPAPAPRSDSAASVAPGAVRRSRAAAGFMDEEADEANDDDDVEDSEARDHHRRKRARLDGETGGPDGNNEEELAEASDLDDFLVDDESGGKSRGQKKRELKMQFLKAGFAEATPMQQGFQPGSTPIIQGKRYLAFNMTGVITSLQQSVRTSYHVEFHDRSRMRRPLQFSDARDFVLASLSSTVAVFATPADETNPAGAPAVIHARMLDGPSAGAEAKGSSWTLPLPEGEEPVAIAAGDERVMVVCKSGRIRIITVGGIVVHVVDLGCGGVVSATAAGGWAAVVRHISAPFNGDQRLGILVYDMSALRTVHDGPVSLSPKSRLEWIGFSSELIPHTYDSAGILRALGIASDRQWTPVLDAKQHTPTSDEEAAIVGSGFYHWPVGMLGSQFYSVLCRVPAGAARAYPPIPRPALTETPTAVQVGTVATAGSASRAAVLAANTALAEMASWSMLRFMRENALGTVDESVQESRDRLAREMDTAVLMAMQAACKSGRAQRALDWARLVVLETGLEKADKLAGFYQMHGVGERIRKMLEDKQYAGLDDMDLDPFQVASSAADPQFPLEEAASRFKSTSAYSSTTSRPSLAKSAIAPSRARASGGGDGGHSIPMDMDDHELDAVSTRAQLPPPPPPAPAAFNPFAAKRSANPFVAKTVDAGDAPKAALSRASSFSRTIVGAPVPSKQSSLLSRFATRKPAEAVDDTGAVATGADQEEDLGNTADLQ
ncbi:hypothetical protein BC828DRAFT_384725 [Blastocladiella britannica]|nr:hypothetical protein BC828DRAFT_384725 [Blastocladiella britannica]